MLDPARSYDLIGDVHGCAHTLERLLDAMGYKRQGGVWRHAQRQAIFLGDIIDRGPRIREALHIVHDMVEAGQAHCIMGNHEFSALGWTTPALPGSGKQFVREHNPRHARLIEETLTQFADHPHDWHDFLGWFYELPLFIDAGRFRVVHACWDAGLIEPLRALFPNGCVDEHFLQASAEPGSFACTVFDRLLLALGVLAQAGDIALGGQLQQCVQGRAVVLLPREIDVQRTDPQPQRLCAARFGGDQRGDARATQALGMGMKRVESVVLCHAAWVGMLSLVWEIWFLPSTYTNFGLKLSASSSLMLANAAMMMMSPTCTWRAAPPLSDTTPLPASARMA